MPQITLGRTGIITEKNAFGALPIQRRTTEDAVALVRRAYEGGMTYFDTARSYSNSEEKLGIAFEGMRDRVYIATKTLATTPEGFWHDLETSLTNLKTDYIDVYQFHNPKICYLPGDGTGMYECMLEAQRQGKIRFIGLTNHMVSTAKECCLSGAYDTLQFPFSYIALDSEIELAGLCRENNVGFIAMKGLAGGLISNAAAAYAFMAQYDNVLPIWGIQREHELEEFLSYFDNPPAMTDELLAAIEKDRALLRGEFCRGCGYCMPCTAGIQIDQCARMSLMLRRSNYPVWVSEYWQQEMKKIENCVDCGLCASRCPYGLDTPALLRRNYADYCSVISGETKVF